MDNETPKINSDKTESRKVYRNQSPTRSHFPPFVLGSRQYKSERMMLLCGLPKDKKEFSPENKIKRYK